MTDTSTSTAYFWYEPKTRTSGFRTRVNTPLGDEVCIAVSSKNKTLTMRTMAELAHKAVIAAFTAGTHSPEEG